MSFQNLLCIISHGAAILENSRQEEVTLQPLFKVASYPHCGILLLLPYELNEQVLYLWVLISPIPCPVFFSNVLKYSVLISDLIQSLWARWSSVSAYCICSVCCHVLFKGNHYKVMYAQALPLPRKLPSRRMLLPELLPSHDLLPLSFTEHLCTKHHHSNRKIVQTKMGDRQHWACSFTGEPTSQDTDCEGSGDFWP